MKRRKREVLGWKAHGEAIWKENAMKILATIFLFGIS
jgi:hypothetical protein